MNLRRKIIRPIRKRIPEFRVPRILKLGFYWSIIAFPVKWMIENWKNQRLRDLLLGLPALIGIIAVPILLGRAQIQDRSLSTVYTSEAEEALDRKDFNHAEMLLTRVLRRKESGLSDAQYSMAVLLDETGQKERAAELFRLLAPDDRQGNRDAHRRLAIILAYNTTWESDPTEISRLYWHLTAAGNDDSAAMAMAWGRYSLATQDIKSAKRYFELAADAFPELWQTLGVIETSSGNSSAAVSNFKRSADYLSQKLKGDPKDQRTRVDYAQVLMKLRQLDAARLILEQGKQIDPDGQWQQLLASLAVGYHDLKSSQGASLSELLPHLERALNYDPNHGPALNRLMAYSTANVQGNVQLKTVLARVIAEGEQPALAHLAMGNLCWIEDNQPEALFHFERALELEDDMAVLLNNLAWLVAHDEESPDLQRAMALINAALEKRPDDPSFLDTRGTIHMLGQDWRQSLNDFEKSLSGVKDKRAVHLKLETVYTRLELPEIAEQHRLLAAALEPKSD